jgi:hypothetical protein
MQGNILLVDDACREEIKNALPGTLLKRRWPPTEFALGRRNLPVDLDYALHQKLDELSWS